VYVTEAFAAALVLAGDRELACDYVGHMAAAKGHGRLRMYRLRRASDADEPGALGTSGRTAGGRFFAMVL
jgi:hypothetical protein